MDTDDNEVIIYHTIDCKSDLFDNDHIGEIAMDVEEKGLFKNELYSYGNGFVLLDDYTCYSLFILSSQLLRLEMPVACPRQRGPAC